MPIIRNKINKSDGVFLCILISFLLAGCSGSRQNEEVFEPSAITGQEETENQNQEKTQQEGTQQEGTQQEGTHGEEDVQDVENSKDSETTVSTDREAPSLVYVQIGGAVSQPGVYEVSADSRIFEVIERAGGLTDEACFEAINQAQQVTDGLMITIPTKEEWERNAYAQEQNAYTTDEDQSQPESGRININTATTEQLCTLPGVGTSRAESIIAYREEHGSFSAIEDIMNVSGIKEGLFQKIKDKIKV